MPDWQAELETILADLHVSLDSAMLGESSAITDIHSPDTAQTVATDGVDAELPWELGALTAEELPDDGDEVSAVRSELEATVARVVALARTGRMDPALRDDVVFVLQALTRPAPRASSLRISRKKQAEARHEWQLASAAAVLRFCRIVLRLTNALTSEAER